MRRHRRLLVVAGVAIFVSAGFFLWERNREFRQLDHEVQNYDREEFDTTKSRILRSYLVATTGPYGPISGASILSTDGVALAKSNQDGIARIEQDAGRSWRASHPAWGESEVAQASTESEASLEGPGKLEIVFKAQSRVVISSSHAVGSLSRMRLTIQHESGHRVWSGWYRGGELVVTDLLGPGRFRLRAGSGGSHVGVGDGQRFEVLRNGEAVALTLEDRHVPGYATLGWSAHLVVLFSADTGQRIANQEFVVGATHRGEGSWYTSMKTDADGLGLLLCADANDVVEIRSSLYANKTVALDAEATEAQRIRLAPDSATVVAVRRMQSKEPIPETWFHCDNGVRVFSDSDGHVRLPKGTERLTVLASMASFGGMRPYRSPTLQVVNGRRVEGGWEFSLPGKVFQPVHDGFQFARVGEQVFQTSKATGTVYGLQNDVSECIAISQEGFIDQFLRRDSVGDWIGAPIRWQPISEDVSYVQITEPSWLVSLSHVFIRDAGGGREVAECEAWKLERVLDEVRDGDWSSQLVHSVRGDIAISPLNRLGTHLELDFDGTKRNVLLRSDGTFCVLDPPGESASVTLVHRGKRHDLGRHSVSAAELECDFEFPLQ